MTHLRKIRLLAIVTAFAMLLAVPATASAGRQVDIDRGRFTTLPGGEALNYSVDGSATMVRFGGSTLVIVQIGGLDANQTYPTHVHNARCSATPPGGSHYQDQVGGPVDSVNEIWPTVSTNRRGNGIGIAWHDERARPDAMSIVVHYPADTSIRLACVDLS